MYYEIALDLPKSDFDFYAGGGFLKPTTSLIRKRLQAFFLSLKKPDIQWHVVTMTIKQNQLRLKK